jgi:phosphoglucosamine mutase
VVETGADIGLALDGDADRLIVVDEKGRVVDGDQMMALIGASWHRKGQLRGGGVVATIMSNLGLERYFEGMGLTLERTKVGDRYVLETMRAKGFNVGGEQSGHMILTDFGTTGDGLVAGLQVLAELVVSGKPASEMMRQFEPLPQLLKNVRFKGKSPLDRGAGAGGDRGWRGAAGRERAGGDPKVGHRAAGPGDGRGRGRGAGGAGCRRHLRGGGGVNAGDAPRLRALR